MGPIIAATDLSARSDLALRRAAVLAERLGAALHIVHVIDDDLPAAILQRRSEEAEAELRARVQGDAILKAEAPRIDVEAGQVAKLLGRIAADRGASLVVVGSHRDRGLAELVGSPALSRLMRAVAVPILVAVEPATRLYTRAVAGWDFSPASTSAMKLAKALAPLEHVTLLHAWADMVTGAPYAVDLASPGQQQRLEEALDQAVAGLKADAPDLEVAREALIAAPAQALIEAAASSGADLIVVGRHARAGLARFLLGETAERVALHAPCDVLIAPPD
ncbi:universal stress protein [uncultured Jannaschia sp.]|uniref:universal stress protein n=1 Tax=uncultured Jannaschia sp. TaxID=293347 RepID=UPI002609808D|nr:universal stress protein [uncultured Jannaschia sp.]